MTVTVVPLDAMRAQPSWARRMTGILSELSYKPWYVVRMGVEVRDNGDDSPPPHRWNGSVLRVRFRTFDSHGEQMPVEPTTYAQAMITGRDVYVAADRLLDAELWSSGPLVTDRPQSRLLVVKDIGFRRALPYSLLTNKFSVLDALGWIRREVWHHIECHEADEFLSYRGRRISDPHGPRR